MSTVAELAFLSFDIPRVPEMVENHAHQYMVSISTTTIYDRHMACNSSNAASNRPMEKKVAPNSLLSVVCQFSKTRAVVFSLAACPHHTHPLDVYTNLLLYSSTLNAQLLLLNPGYHTHQDEERRYNDSPQLDVQDIFVEISLCCSCYGCEE